jgi:tripartite-type tricarboxylate transporter receptor subunit TctC
MVAPTGTPENIVRKVSDDLKIILGNPEVRSKLAAVGSYARPMSPQDTTDFLHGISGDTESSQFASGCCK